MLQRSQASNMKGDDTRHLIAQVESMDELPMGEEDQSIGVDLEKMAALGAALVKKRDEAKEHRAESGIEKDWEEDEEFYQSVDAANPEGESNASAKPVSPDGSASTDRTRIKESRSSVFIPITRAYVDAASARVADMLLPNDDKPWELKPTPVSDSGPQQAQTPVAAAAAGVAGNGPMPTMPGAQPGFDPSAYGGGDAQAMNDPNGIARGPAPVQLPAGVASSALTDDEKRAECASERIQDWMVECQWTSEVRKVIEDAAKVGSGVLKGPFPVQKTVQKVMRGPDGGMQLVQETMVVPISKRVSYRNFFPAPDSGENHQNGSYTFEYDSIGMRELRKLAKDPTYIRENVIKVLKEGPNFAWSKNAAPTEKQSEQVRIGGTFPLWYFYGDLDREMLLAAGLSPDDLGEDEDEQALASLPALVIMVNDTVIKATLSPMDTGGFPYDVFCWQRRESMVWGKGVSRQMRTPQRMLNASVRAMMDNAGLSSGPMWAMRQQWIVPIDGVAALGPRKGFYMTQDAPPTAKIADALSFTNIDSNVTELKLLVDMAMKFAEDATGLPMLMQGQQGEATDTAAGMTILNNNGSTVLRRIARTFDDGITEPHVRRYYAWLMENAGNDECKGDFQIDARGSSYLVERDLQNKTLNQLVPFFAQHPDVHPGRLAEEVARANRLNFRVFMLTDAEKKARDAMPKPEAPAIQVAKIRDEGDTKRLQLKLQAELQQAAKDNQIEEGHLQKEFELGLAKLENDGRATETNAKALLATTVMKLRADMHERHKDRVVEGATRISDEQPGRAPNGQAVIA